MSHVILIWIIILSTSSFSLAQELFEITKEGIYKIPDGVDIVVYKSDTIKFHIKDEKYRYAIAASDSLYRISYGRTYRVWDLFDYLGRQLVFGRFDIDPDNKSWNDLQKNRSRIREQLTTSNSQRTYDERADLEAETSQLTDKIMDIEVGFREAFLNGEKIYFGKGIVFFWDDNGQKPILKASQAREYQSENKVYFK